MQIENLGSIEYCEHSWVVLDKKLDQKSQNLSHKSAVHTNTTRDYHSNRQTKLSCRWGAAARILSKYQASHVTFKLKISSLNLWSVDQSESHILNPVLWLVGQSQTHGGNFKLIDHVTILIPCKDFSPMVYKVQFE